MRRSSVLPTGTVGASHCYPPWTWLLGVHIVNTKSGELSFGAISIMEIHSASVAMTCQKNEVVARKDVRWIDSELRAAWVCGGRAEGGGGRDRSHQR